MAIAKVTSQGRVTIPLEIRQQLALETGSKVEFELAGTGAAVMKPVRSSLKSRQGVFRESRRKPISLKELEEAIAAEAGSGMPEKPLSDAST
ncbi:AbrB family looped-hinge helix DNA binding protein [Arthrobacter pigmenti]|uniref:AbrB family looped-hinge helix DNA binding protein n=1 Tax=Arthrobacter pigmenti TaxID=271432 RepID=A0A846RNZ8_9MICC|nr:AbrB/MazE/SpoVT family DNA-binding domain-containing protein [Arthrobacter pigmenti]NJC21505.1 AbrB family looped-hinge helix DNA binding protein [Arthrobacter pigmenti]